jgi:hypothetical protein
VNGLQRSVVVEREQLDVVVGDLVPEPDAGERARTLQEVTGAEDQAVAEDELAATDAPLVTEPEHVVGAQVELRHAVEVLTGQGIRVALRTGPGLGEVELGQGLDLLGRLIAHADPRPRRLLVGPRVRIAGAGLRAAHAQPDVTLDRQLLRTQVEGAAGVDLAHFRAARRAEGEALVRRVVAILRRDGASEGNHSRSDGGRHESAMHRSSRVRVGWSHPGASSTALPRAKGRPIPYRVEADRLRSLGAAELAPQVRRGRPHV